MARPKIPKKLTHYAVCSYQVDSQVLFPLFVNFGNWEKRLFDAKKDLKEYRKQCSDAFYYQDHRRTDLSQWKYINEF